MATWAGIWRGLSKDDRAQAVRTFLETAGEGDERDLGLLIHHVAQTRSFRPATVEKTPPEKIAGWVAAGKDPPERLIMTLVVRWHLAHRVELLSAFLDRLGIKHARGRIEDSSKPVPPSAEALVDAVRHVARMVPIEDVARYLDCLELRDGDGFWTHLPAARKAAIVVPSGDAEERPQAGVEEPPGGFSTLDHLLIDAAVACAQRAEGALDQDELHDLVGEIMSLSSKRQRSYFHRGFVEALTGAAQPVLLGSEMNDERRAWQLTGFLTGCARQQRSAEIDTAMKANPETVTKLAAGAFEASEHAVPLIFDQIVRTNGLPVAAGFLQAPAVVAAGAKFASDLLDHAIRLMRPGQIDEAAPALQLLDRAIRTDADGVITQNVRLEHSRRMGQLYRRWGNFQRAAETFGNILAANPPEWMRRRSHADLGLCRAHLRGLEDVWVPEEPGARSAMKDALARGQADFEAAVGASIRTGGHGEYCLGVLRMLEARLEDGLPLFERAVSEMSAEPAIYQPRGVLPRARLYLARCGVAASLDPSAVEAHLRVALDAIPGEVKPFLGDLLIGLALADSGRAAAFAALAFESMGDAVLVAASATEVFKDLPALRDALLDRARSEGRPASERFEAAKSALVASRAANDRDRAREAFDLLESLAHRTEAERRRFLDLVGDVEKWESVWEPHEVRLATVPLLIEENRPIDAANALLVVARGLAARGDEGSLSFARDLMEEAGKLGAEAPPDLDRLVRAGEAPPNPVGQPEGRILFVGGNETQAQYHDELVARVRARWPQVTLVPVLTGWSSNWGREVTKIETKIQDAGAVVLMRFMRTMLGEALRALCSEHKKPWIPCTGHGRESIMRSIERAVARLPSRGVPPPAPPKPQPKASPPPSGRAHPRRKHRR